MSQVASSTGLGPTSVARRFMPNRNGRHLSLRPPQQGSSPSSRCRTSASAAVRARHWSLPAATRCEAGSGTYSSGCGGPGIVWVLAGPPERNVVVNGLSRAAYGYVPGSSIDEERTATAQVITNVSTAVRHALVDPGHNPTPLMRPNGGHDPFVGAGWRHGGEVLTRQIDSLVLVQLRRHEATVAPAADLARFDRLVPDCLKTRCCEGADDELRLSVDRCLRRNRLARQTGV